MPEKQRYWVAFGLEEPVPGKNTSIVVEMNPPFSGRNRTLGGVFLSDAQGRLYLGHTGKVAGGKKGVSKSAFTEFYAGDHWVDFEDANGSGSAVVFGPLQSKSLLRQIADYVRTVQKFKGASNAILKKAHRYSPEFSGKKKYKRKAGTVTATCNHGLVVQALYEALHEAGVVRRANDKNRDLYTIGSPRIAFEVKTDLLPYTIYTAIGQLAFHAAVRKPAPALVLVAPGTPKPKTREVLKRLGLHALSYTQQGERYVFPRLKELLANVRANSASIRRRS